MNKDHIDFPVDWGHRSYRIISKTRRTSNDRFRIALKPYFLGFNQVEIDAPMRHPTHRHSSYELIVVNQGPYRCLLNKKLVELDTTRCLLIKPGDLHEVTLQPGQRHLVLQFDLEERSLSSSLSISVFDSNITPEKQAFTIPSERIEPLLHAIASPATIECHFASEIQDSLIEQIFWNLLSFIPEDRLAPAFRKLSNDQRFLDRLEKISQEHSDRHLTLDQLARHMEMSKSTLAKRSTELLGETPSHYLLRLKIDAAAALLSMTDRPIKEISFELGFQNPYHFSRVFKRITQQSPSDFRNSSSPQKPPPE